MSLPLRLPWDKAQDRWATEINPVIQNQLVNGLLILSIPLINGVTVVNHKLGRQMQGWAIVDINASASVYRSQPFNDKTLTLTSNAAATANLWVF